MAKTYIDTVKYRIIIEFEIQGIVDKHDVIGAIFGQSEGLMGEDLDLRELQKNGKIGRIEVNAESHSGKTTGELFIPSSMDMVKTSLLAASIESVDKVGPCNSVFRTKKIEDTRIEKRQRVKERAKELLKELTAGMPESSELTEAIKNDLRAAELQEFGKEKLPAGPCVDKADELVVVEGRADVINLLKHGIKNVIAVNGVKIPKTIMEISKQKSVTAFVDGDRGGELIARKLVDVASIDFIARAPAGKEVEELTGKEIIMALRKKAPVRELGRGSQVGQAKRMFFKQAKGKRSFQRMSGTRFQARGIKGKQLSQQRAAFIRGNELGGFGPILRELENSLKARLFGKNMEVLKEVSVRDLLEAMKREKNIEAVVFDGIVTKRLLEQAEKSGVKTLVGIKKGKIEKPSKVNVLTLG